jgi:hypothetical protein
MCHQVTGMNLRPVLLLSFVVPVLAQDPPRKKGGLAKGAITLGDKAESKAQRIPDGTEHEFLGVRFDLPKGWTFAAGDEGAELKPPGGNAKGPVQEKYALIHDDELLSLDGEAIAESVQELADAVQEGLTKEKPQKTEFGDLEGRLFAFAGQGADGKALAVRVHAFRTGKSVCVLAAMGYAERVGRRESDLKAILGSMRPAGSEARAGKPAVDSDAGATEPAAEPAKGGKRKRIAGGASKQFQGVAFDLPRNWSMESKDGATALVPAGANPQGVLEEAYVLVSDPEVKKLDGPEVDASVDQAVQGIQAGAQRKGPPQKVRFGDVDGRLYVYGGADAEGRKIEVRMHGFLGKTGACALVALGYADVLGRRQKELQGILDSMGAPPAGKKGAAGERPPELVGQWAWITSFNATSGGGRQTETVLTLNGDGTYTFFGLSSSSNPLGSATSETRERGTWTATEDSLTLTCDGQARTFAMEKRNHPKNVNDPMIVLDGKAFVTVTLKAPWR